MGLIGKFTHEVKWGTRQRYQYIEVMAYYTGVITRKDIAQTFGISDAAATKDLKAYNELAPQNLLYKHTVFGFIPTNSFSAVFADLSPSTVLPMIAANLSVVGNPSNKTDVYGINVDMLPLPSRLPSKEISAQIIRAIKNHQKLRVMYHSLSARQDNDENTFPSRVIEPHALVNNGLRWHVRAYSEENYDFRDFVLSRIRQAQLLTESAESSAQYDDAWIETVTLQLKPHPHLSPKKQRSLLYDFNAEGELIELTVRQAMVAYVLQRLAVDTSMNHSMDAKTHQLIVVNRDEIKDFAGWSFVSG